MARIAKALNSIVSFLEIVLIVILMFFFRKSL